MSEHWQSRPEGGGHFAIWLFCAIALRGGRRLGRALLYPITLYFYLRRQPERDASRHFLERVLGKPVSVWQVMKHLHAFAAVTFDRIFLLAHGEKNFDIAVEGLDALESTLAQGKGLLLVGSHQGSFEALRVLSSRRPDIPLRVVLDKQKTPSMTELFETLAPDIGAHVIDASLGGASITLAMAEACEKGAMVALLADRGREHEVLRRTPFLGEPAPFPVGPWLLAHSLRVPVMLCFGLYEGGNRYRLVFEPFADPVEIPRHDRTRALDAWIARYASRVEHYVHVAPYNWFNFYDFWQQDVATAVRPDAVAVRERVGA
ncbi:acyltransferase [Dyella amyloliquefaciens]|uniref:LpxL/LpxP family acyltransferase n=1 Tax=Dyella amyloliquefaciens TaxID=1770545 RepID=UPI00102E602F|nr:acyltransferase [Dyella amyloliquefaciens]